MRIAVRFAAVLAVGAAGCAMALQFSATASAQSTETVVYSFCGEKNCADGDQPFASLLDVNGTLYGTTEWGGTHCKWDVPLGCGTVFSVNPTTGAETVVYSLCSQKKCNDGAWTAASLIYIKGTLYGATSGRGIYYGGTAFALNPSTGAQTVLHSFGSGTDGVNPWAGLLDVNGTLYGTTCCGGANANGGTVFALNPKTGVETVVYSFCSQTNCTDGAGPLASLTEVNGTLYGTTASGGANLACFCGTVFSVNPTTGAETVIYSFCSQKNCKDGAGPVGSLIAVNGSLYGTTSGGGSNTNCPNSGGFAGCGTVFAIDLSTGAETVLHSFGKGTDGMQPDAGLTEVKGSLYGTTQQGGSNANCGWGGQGGCGTVFSIDLSTLRENVLYSFCSQANCTDGMFPLSNLVAVKGVLYGTTRLGGTNGSGTVFAIMNP